MALPAISDDLFCPACGYMLRGLTEYRCPECGRPFDPAKMVPEPIPWAKRNQLGRICAYLQTLFITTFSIYRLAEQVRRPVSYGDAQLFRWVTVVVAYAPCVLMILAFRPSSGSRLLFRGLYSGPPTMDPWTVTSVFAATLLALVVATGVPSYFFHPRWLDIERQNRGIAISTYACGPLGWTPLACVLGYVIAALVAMTGAAGLEDSARVAVASLLVVELLWWWFGLVYLSRRATGRGAAGVFVVALAGPLVWLLAVGLTLVAVRFLVVFPVLIYHSLRG
ncbi:MAG TPA: zinc ribbon domain-containing protein [Phycisphaerae bacterium]|nr:zinc ribbon domain-containing protein [Phycisphaerae bacterium]HRY66624.1 zinc ribbon domain-containing protein [Phycisphaerae bacterium]HSA29081.1 zinc ribbon domain-containing protein [Phycisphaerae bacterium]